MDIQAEPHPIDFEALDRGSLITARQITRAYGHEPGTKEYQFDRMTLLGLIKRHFLEERDDVVSISCPGDCIRILTHKEQDVYVVADKRKAIRRFIRRHHEDMGTDDAELDEEARKRRERRLLSDGWKLQQLRRRNPPVLEP